ncbi:MAG: isoprenylcysteine carboxylmethyltransferase family protein [Anaerolineales bacterium]|nr:isoprenylcysteine carboxylmethyltransferase family protein [Anaerolineales bacterium]
MATNALPLTPRVVVQLVIVLVLMPGLPLLLTQRWTWWEAWAYAAITALGFVISRMLAARRNPGILVERSRSFEHQDTEPWDRVLAPLVAIGGGLIPLLAGLEALWATPVPYEPVVRGAAFLALLAGYGLGTYALVENPFFSGTVRIQTDRGHHVIASGPYSWVRHPGYSSALLSFAATPFLLDSRWGLPAVAFLIGALILRTHLEDQTLKSKLPGYADYAAQVRFRLVPGIW